MTSIIEATVKSPTNAGVLEMLRAKVRQCREDAERARDEATEAQRNYDAERKRREQVFLLKIRHIFLRSLIFIRRKQRWRCSVVALIYFRMTLNAPRSA